jgi:hypothetical protein
MAHVRAVKKELEKGKLKEFEKIVDVHIVAGVLKNFLIELEEPLLTFELSESFIKAVSKLYSRVITRNQPKQQKRRVLFNF